MSVEAITWVISQQVSHSSAKFVLVMLANCADGQDFVAWPSVAYLSDCTGQDRKTVLENLKRLREAGFIEDTGERKGSTKQVTVYRIKCPVNGSIKEAQKRNSTENGTVPISTDNSPVFPVKESRFSVETVPKTGHGTINEPSIEPKKKREPAAQDFILPDWINKKHWDAWHSCDKRKKASHLQKQISLEKLEAWRAAGIDYAAALENAAVGGWQGLFKPDE